MSWPKAILPPWPNGAGVLLKDKPARSSNRFPVPSPSFEDVAEP